MSLNYKNYQLFSEIFLQDLIEREIDNKNYEDYFKAFVDWKNFADFSTEEKIIESYLIPISNTLGFTLKKDKENPNVLRLFSISDENEFLSYCYIVSPEEDIDCFFKGKFWPAKLIKILQENKKCWGILTDGYVWRLYYTKEPNVYENYFEVDLKEILDNKNIDAFSLFYYFFNASNYRLNKDGGCSYDFFKASSIKAIEFLGEKLKHSIEREKNDEPGALQALCQGFISYINKDFYTEAERTNIYGSSILLLFRMLFLFYASSRELLSNTDLFNFKKLVKESFYLVKSNSDEKKEYNLWKILQELFTNIDDIYDGGLFDPAENTFTQFIKVNAISDFYISRALYELGYWVKSKDRTIEIDYKDLSVRHFGSLYEGLLEQNLFIAAENLIIRKSDNKINFIPESKVSYIIKTDTIIEKGKIYFSDDPTERKDSGSYYTPEDVVEYIVQNTLGMLLKEKKEEFRNEIRKDLDEIRFAISETEITRIRNYIDKRVSDFINNEILEITVLDPTMGSGHFLVNALNLLTNFVIETLNETSWYNLNIDSNPISWKRRIINSCIFGVDLNPLAVELAKLCLWIISAEKDKPLSFINHHLKCGNSLIGIFKKDIDEFSINNKESINLFLSKYLENLREISKKYIPTFSKVDDSKLDTDNKKEVFLKVNKNIEPLKNLYDLFLDHITKNKSLREFEEAFIEIVNSKRIKETSTNFFHWEIEFPDILLKENPGFSCIIGNPPYVEISKINYSEKLKNYETKLCGNIYALVVERAYKLLSQNGFFGMILQQPSICTDRMIKLQNIFLDKEIVSIASFSDRPGKLFKNLEHCRMAIIITNNQRNNKNVFTTDYIKFKTKNRNQIFNNLNFIDSKKFLLKGSIPKIGSKIKYEIFDKIFNINDRLGNYIDNGEQKYKIFYNNAPCYFIRAQLSDVSDKLNYISVNQKENLNLIFLLLNSNIFYIFTDTFFQGRTGICLRNKDFHIFPFSNSNTKINDEKLLNISDTLNTIYKEIENKEDTYKFKNFLKRAKPTVDKIDTEIANIYKFNDSELDFIINYDLEFRI